MQIDTVSSPFFFNDTATTEIYTLSLHDALPILRRAALVRAEIGPDRKLMLDANQVWDVPEAITWMRELARFDPWWIEEPTSPDDVLGHAAIAKAVAPIGVATG